MTHLFVSQIDNLAETISEDIREVVPLDNLPILAFIHDEQEVKAAFTTIDHADFIVSPLVVCVFIHGVTALVQDVYDLYAL